MKIEMKCKNCDIKIVTERLSTMPDKFLGKDSIYPKKDLEKEEKSKERDEWLNSKEREVLGCEYKAINPRETGKFLLFETWLMNYYPEQYKKETTSIDNKFYYWECPLCNHRNYFYKNEESEN